MIEINSIVSRRQDIDTTDLDGDKVMMDLEKGQYFALNSVASTIWDEIENPIEVNEIVNKLLKEYEVEREECEKSVLEFLEGLNNASLLSTN